MPVIHQVGTVPRLQPVIRGERRPSDPLKHNIDDVWAEHIDGMTERLNLKPTLMASVSLDGQTASIGATDIGDTSLSAGQYIVLYYIAIERAASVSSGLQLQLSFTHNSVAKSETFANMTGNTTATHQNGVKFIRVDGGSPIRYATTYATAGATTMAYSIDIALYFVRT